jgi:MYXO-CTERM domain-containing protein
MTPLAEGYPRDQAIENAATVRVTRPGLDFFAQNGPSVASKLVTAPGGVVTFDIPQTNAGDNIICVGGPVAGKCRAELNVGAAKMRVDAITPSSIRIAGTLPVKLSPTPVRADIPVIGNVNVVVGYGDNGRCVNNAPVTTPYELPITVTLPLVAETVAPRNGYTTIDINKATFDLSGLNGDQVRICTDCGIITFGCDAVLNSGLIKNAIVGQLRDGVANTLKSTMAGFLCTKPDPAEMPPCPTGSRPDAKGEQCVYDRDPTKCVPTLLGTEGRVNLGALLRSLSPGTQGTMDFALAAGGDMQPFPKAGPDNVGYPGHTPNGMTLGMMGGALPAPVSNCVTPAKLTVPTGIPTPDELTQDKPMGWTDPTGPHLGVGLSARFLDFTFGSLYNSGFLCLSVSTEQVSALQSGLVSLFAPSLKNLTFNREKAAMGIATRPGAPPKITMGGGTNLKTDPLLKVSLPRFAVDFYIWSYDRFVRAFTYTADLTVPVNLQTAKTAGGGSGIAPAVGEIDVKNDALTNYEQLLDDPKRISDGLRGVIGGIVGQFLGTGIGPIDLSTALSSFGLGLNVPEGGIRRLTKGEDEFLAVFGNFKTATAAMPQFETRAELLEKKLDREALERHAASLRLRLSSPTANGVNVTGNVEFAYRIDRAHWSAWSSDRELLIRDAILELQGKHILYVAARAPALLDTQDETPVEIPFVVDTLPPVIDAAVKDGKLQVDAWDYVSESNALKVRVSVDGKAAGDFVPYKPGFSVTLPSEANEARIEVIDEEGNLGVIQQGLRGRGDGSLAPAGGCACDSGAKGEAPTWYALPLAAVVALVLGRRSRRKATSEANSHGSTVSRYAVAAASLAVVGGAFGGCSCDEEKTECGDNCNQACEPALTTGITGAYLSAARATDGTIWVAGFSDAAIEETTEALYGDLALGKFNAETNRVEWFSVDGVPARTDGTCPKHDRKGFRSGELEAGDTVGLWTSLRIDEGNRPQVSYYDQSNRTLKFAGFSGDKLKTHVVFEKAGADVGRYGKLVTLEGKPAIVFLVIEPGNAGRTRSKVVLAQANIATPEGPGDWSLRDLYVDEQGPCTAKTCGGDACVKATGTCQKRVNGCTPADCGAGNACISQNNQATCVGVATVDALETYPNAFGAYIAAAVGPDGLAVVAYDRIRGNLIGLVKTGSNYQPVVLDGETGTRPNAKDTGDVGIGASLAVTPDGTWHVSYANGFEESLRYLTFSKGKASPPQLVDDGTQVDGKAFPDGKHIVGDDSHIRVEGDKVSIVYQDATSGTLRLAVGTGAGAKTWTRRALDPGPKFGGFFPRFIEGDARVAHFWRQTIKDKSQVIGDVSLITP